jgi:photosystem II stability/assembly factor-like uncharacterized protein
MRASVLSVALLVPLGLGGAPATARALQATDSAQRAASWADHQTMERDSYFRGLAWRSDGPVKIGARVAAIAIPPGNAGTIYVGVGAGNLWKTVNNGITWRPIFDHESAFAIGDVAVSASDPNIVWVGTGEAQPRFAGYAYPGTGVFKSVDAGESWTPMGLAGTQHIGKVLIDPANPDIVYVAAMGRQWSPNAERGVFRTRDGGRHWARVLFVDDSTGVVDLAMDPRDPATLYAWAWQIEQGRTGGLFKSTDGGDRWRRITDGLPTGPLGRAHVAVAPGDPNVVYLFLDNRGPATVPGRPYVGGEVFRSDDRGEHWRKANTQDIYAVFGVFGWKFTGIRVDPRNADHVYILGNRAFQSFDGGATWQRLGDRILRVHHTDGRAMHLDQHALVIDPADPDRLLLGNDGGLFMSYDGGESWLHLNDIPVSQMYFVATDDRSPYRIFAGTQDDAAVYGPSDASVADAEPDPWRSVYLDRWTGGDSFVTLPDPTDPRIVYYEHQNGDIRRMDVTGSSVLTGGPSATDIRPRAPRGAPRIRFSWYTPFFISPFDPRTLYAGGNQVLKSTDRGAHWRVVSPDLGDPPGTDRGLVTTGALTMLTESPRVRGMLAGGTEGGRVWLTLDDGATWRRIDAGLPQKWVSRVTLSRWDAGTIYVSFTGFREDDDRPYVFASRDTGRTWRSIAANLPLESVNVVKEDPDDRDVLFVGTDLGVYVSRDRGQRWESLSATLPSTAVMDLTVQRRARELVIGTYGRGAWILDLVPIRDSTTVSAARPLHLYPIRAAMADWFPWEAVPGERRGRSVARFAVATAAGGTAAVAVQDSAGHVVRRWHAAVTPGVNTLVWDLQAERPNGSLRDAAPGRYTVDVSVGTARASGAITVRADPSGPR